MCRLSSRQLEFLRFRLRALIDFAFVQREIQMFRFGLAIVLAVLVCGSCLAADSVLKMESKDWKYLDTGKDPGQDWTKSEFDDSQWKSGQAPLGYGDDDIKQKISFGEDEENKHLCAFFRRTIDVKDPTSAKQFRIRLICDDGCAIYLNGEEVHRHNLPEGELSTKTMAPLPLSGEIERHKFSVLVDPAKLKAGNNIVAVRVHQRHQESSDLAIDLSVESLTTDEEVAETKSQQQAEKEAIERALQRLSELE